MKRFGYARDPLCLLACGLYVLNRCWLRGAVDDAFLQGSFNDLLLIPAALPVWLWLQRRIGLRREDAPPRWSEIALHVVTWSVAAEWIAPQLLAHATADWHDVAAYAVGAVAAGTWWNAAG